MHQTNSQDGPNDSPFFAGLNFCLIASSKLGFVSPGALHTSSLTCSSLSSLCVKRTDERLTSEKCPPLNVPRRSLVRCLIHFAPALLFSLGYDALLCEWWHAIVE